MPGIRTIRISNDFARLPPAVTQLRQWMESEEAEMEQARAARELDIQLLLNQVPNSSRNVAERAYDRSNEDVGRALEEVSDVVAQVEQFALYAWWPTDPQNPPTHLPPSGEHMRSYEELGLNTHIRGTRPPELSATEILNQLALLEVSRGDFPNATSLGARAFGAERMTDLAILVSIMDLVEDIDPAMVPIAPVLASMFYICAGGNMARAAIGFNTPSAVARCKAAILNGDFPHPGYYPNYNNMATLAAEFEARKRQLRVRRSATGVLHLHPDVSIGNGYTDREDADVVVNTGDEAWESASSVDSDEGEPMPQLAQASSSSGSEADEEADAAIEDRIRLEQRAPLTPEELERFRMVMEQERQQMEQEVATNMGPLHIPDRQPEEYVGRQALSDRSWSHLRRHIHVAQSSVNIYQIPLQNVRVYRPSSALQPASFRHDANDPIPSPRARARTRAVACYKDYLKKCQERLEERVASGEIDEKTYMEQANSLMKRFNHTDKAGP